MMSGIDEGCFMILTDQQEQLSLAVLHPETQVLTPKALRKLARTRSLDQWIDYETEGLAHADHA